MGSGALFRLAVLAAAIAASVVACAAPAVEDEVDESEGALTGTCESVCATDGELEATDLLVSVNRSSGLKRTFAPKRTRVPDAYAAQPTWLRPLALGYFMQMADAAKRDLRRTIKVGSGYRGFCRQCELFDGYAKKEGEAKADTFSARAGHSEHQLGTTADIFSETDTFMGGPYDIPGTCEADAGLYAWLDAHAYEFGYMNSYPPNDAEAGDRLVSRTYRYTKYVPEPWHWRFVGKRAAEVHHALSLETQVRFSTHEFIDLLTKPLEALPEGSREHAERARLIVTRLGYTVESLELEHDDDRAAAARVASR